MEYDLNLREYWRIIRKRKAIVFFSAVLMGALSFGLAFLQKPVPIYESTATVKVEKSSTTTGVFLEALAWSSADYLATQTSIITSYPIMEKVAKELGRIDSKLDSNEIRADSDLITIVLALKDMVIAEREGDSNLINITSQSKDAKEAQSIANTVGKVYAIEHSEEVNKRTFDSRLFIENQLKRVGERLRQAEDAVRAYREEHKLVSLDSQTTELLRKIATAEAKQLEISESVDEIGLVLDRIITAKENPLTSKDSFFISNPPPIYNNLNAKLVTLLLEKDSLSLTYTDEHPKVTEISSQINEILANMQSLLEEMLSTAQIRSDDLTGNINKYQHEISALPDKGLTLARLERDVVLNEKVYAQLESKLQDANIMAAAKIEEVTIVKPALEPRRPINSPKIRLKALAGAFIGFIIGLVFAFVYETMDTSIGAIEEIEEFTELKVLGTIPAADIRELKESAKKHLSGVDFSDEALTKRLKLVTHYLPNTVPSECYRSVRANVLFAGHDRQVKTIGFTSAVAGEGKSTSITNVAIAMAQANNKVLLVEADLRKPTIAKSFGIDATPGLTDLILGSYEWRDVVQNITDFMLGEMDVDEVVLNPGLDNLHVIPSGSVHSNPAELLSSPELDKFLEEAKKEYEFILFDLSPVLSAADASIACSKMDAGVIVYRAGGTSRGALRRAKTQLDNAHVNIIGIVINGLKAEMSLDYSDMHYHRYYMDKDRVGGGGAVITKKPAWLAEGPQKFIKKQRSSWVPKGVEKIAWWKVGVIIFAFLLLGLGVFWQMAG